MASTATATVPAGSTVTVVVEPAPVDDGHIADLADLWLAFLAAGVVIFCARRLVDLFRGDIE
jgi:hypothetical protein